MKILAFDTSSDILSAALFENDRKVAGLSVGARRAVPLRSRHSEALWEAFESLLKKSKWKASQIDAVAVGLGPGSFTGLRVGVTAAKVMVFSLGAKIVGVSSLAAMAWPHLDRDNAVAAVLDARKGDVYGAVYKRTGGWPKEIIKPCLMNANAFIDQIPKNTFIVGRGSTIVGAHSCAPLQTAYPSADSVATLAYHRLKIKKIDDPMTLQPTYLHAKDCNVTLPGKKS